MLPSFIVIMQQQELEDCSKVVRISNINYKKITSQAKFGMTFNDALSNLLQQKGECSKINA